MRAWRKSNKLEPAASQRRGAAAGQRRNAAAPRGGGRSCRQRLRSRSELLGRPRGAALSARPLRNISLLYRHTRDRPAPRGLDTSDVPSTTRNECGTRQECGHRPAGHHHLRRLGAGWPLLGRLRARRVRDPRPRTRTCMKSSVFSDWV